LDCSCRRSPAASSALWSAAVYMAVGWDRTAGLDCQGETWPFAPTLSMAKLARTQPPALLPAPAQPLTLILAPGQILPPSFSLPPHPRVLSQTRVPSLGVGKAVALSPAPNTLQFRQAGTVVVRSHESEASDIG
jgi:hypothetical protein